MAPCPKCGNNINASLAGACSVCGLANGSTSVPAKPRAFSIPWDSIDALGVFESMGKTAFSCLLHPRKFFAAAAQRSATYRAWIFALVVGSIGMCFEFFWSRALIGQMTEAIRDIPVDLGIARFNANFLLATPLVVTLRIAIVSIYAQSMLLITRNCNHDLSATFSALCFAECTVLLSIIPGIGSIVGLVWWMVLVVAGLAVTHRISALRVVLAMVFPLFILAGIAFFALFSGLGVGLAANSILKEFFGFIR